MSIVARLDLDRSDRAVVARTATLRDGTQVPSDIVLDNLSTSGCLILVDFPLQLDAIVSIGIPGVGNCFARVCRAEQPNYGCEFLRPITSAEVAKAKTADSVVRAAFLQNGRLASVRDEDVERERNRIPVSGRAAIIVGITGILWGGIIASLWVTAS